jgi:hypothetical protein
VAFLNWRLGLTQLTAWWIEVAPVPGLSEVATPTRAIITIPITLYGYGNGDDAEEGGPERRRDGREHGEHKRDKARRCSRSARPLGITEMYQVPATSRPRFIPPLLREGVAAE